MWEEALKELLLLERKIYRKLDETYQITQELAEAVSRGDQVSVGMLISSRQTPVLELKEGFASVYLKRCDLSGDDEKQFDRLISSGGQPQSPAEQEVANQITANRRLWEKIVTLDRRVNERICRDQSIYYKH